MQHLPLALGCCLKLFCLQQWWFCVSAGLALFCTGLQHTKHVYDAMQGFSLEQAALTDTALYDCQNTQSNTQSSSPEQGKRCHLMHAYRKCIWLWTCTKCLVGSGIVQVLCSYSLFVQHHPCGSILDHKCSASFVYAGIISDVTDVFG